MISFFHQFIQKPGQFVVSLSGVYHSGFNLGFNKAEAINFGTASSVEKFKEYECCTCE